MKCRICTVYKIDNELPTFGVSIISESKTDLLQPTIKFPNIQPCWLNVKYTEENWVGKIYWFVTVFIKWYTAVWKDWFRYPKTRQDIARSSSPASFWFVSTVGLLEVGSWSQPPAVLSTTPLVLLRVLEVLDHLDLGPPCLARTPASLPASLWSTRGRDGPHWTQSGRSFRSTWTSRLPAW